MARSGQQGRLYQQHEQPDATDHWDQTEEDPGTLPTRPLPPAGTFRLQAPLRAMGLLLVLLKIIPARLFATPAADRLHQPFDLTLSGGIIRPVAQQLAPQASTGRRQVITR